MMNENEYIILFYVENQIDRFDSPMIFLLQIKTGA